MKQQFSFYELKKKSKLNSQDQNDVQKGALLRISDGDNWGVADISPKPELGDDSLESEIRNKGLLYLRAVELAMEDMLSRKNKKSLLNDKPIKNNYLVTAYKVTDFHNTAFTGSTVKIKADKDILWLANVLNSKTESMKIRLDFNSCLTVDEFIKFTKLLSADTKSRIEYVEDPVPMSEHWLQLKTLLPIAYDMQILLFDPRLADFRIIKPSRQRIPMEFKNITLTSAMEHPVGLAHALRLAQQHATNDSGFLVLDLFEKNSFHEYFVQNGPELNFSEKALKDYGIGMTEELQKINWIDL